MRIDEDNFFKWTSPFFWVYELASLLASWGRAAFFWVKVWAVALGVIPSNPGNIGKQRLFYLIEETESKLKEGRFKGLRRVKMRLLVRGAKEDLFRMI